MAESVLVTGLGHLQSDPQLIYGLGLTYTLQGNMLKAHQTFEDGLKLVESKLRANPRIGADYADAALFRARLGNKKQAINALLQSTRLDSEGEDILMKAARTYAILGKKPEMLEWFKHAKSLNVEFDAAYLSTALDFEKYRTDADLLSIARQE